MHPLVGSLEKRIVLAGRWHGHRDDAKPTVRSQDSPGFGKDFGHRRFWEELEREAHYDSIEARIRVRQGRDRGELELDPIEIPGGRHALGRDRHHPLRKIDSRDPAFGSNSPSKIHNRVPGAKSDLQNLFTRLGRQKSQAQLSSLVLARIAQRVVDSADSIVESFGFRMIFHQAIEQDPVEPLLNRDDNSGVDRVSERLTPPRARASRWAGPEAP